MKTTNQELEYEESPHTAKSILAGLLIGGLAGAGAMLLLAPQSGKETRSLIQHKTLELRDRTVETVDEAVTQIKSKTSQIKADVLDKAGELQDEGKQLLVKQLDHVSAAAEAGKAAVKNS